MTYYKYIKVIDKIWFKLNFIVKSSRRLNTISKFKLYYYKLKDFQVTLFIYHSFYVVNLVLNNQNFHNVT